jgi:uncharacterized membrane protein
MFAVLTGMGFSGAAGLNAFIPLTAIAILSRFTGFLELTPSFSWITSWPAIIVFLCFLTVELVLDKIPGVDTVNDVFQTVIRPASGALVFTAAATAQGFGSSQARPCPHWVAYTLGALLALTVHLCKAASRTAIGAATGGSGTPLASFAEDGLALTLCLFAVLFPPLVVLLLGGMGVAVYRIVTIGRRRRQRLTERQRQWRAEREAADREAGLKGWLARPTRRFMARAGRAGNGSGKGEGRRKAGARRREGGPGRPSRRRVSEESTTRRPRRTRDQYAPGDSNPEPAD